MQTEFSPTGTHFSTLLGGSLQIWNTETLRPCSTLNTKNNNNNNIKEEVLASCFSPDGKRVLTSHDNCLRIWSVPNLQLEYQTPIDKVFSFQYEALRHRFAPTASGYPLVCIS